MTHALTLRALAETFEAMRATRSSRLKEAILGDFLAAVASDDSALRVTARMCAGKGLAAGDPRNVGAGWSLVMEVACALTGFSPGILAACARATGDLGEAVALLVERLPGAEERAGLTLAEVAELLDRLARAPRRSDKGPILFRALARCSPVETKYLLRSLGGGLRIGAQETLVLAAIARAFDRDAESVRWAFSRTGDSGVVASLARDGQLATAAFELGRPAAFMLATPYESIKTPLDPALFVVEDKIDGIRAQVHKRGPEVTVFARGLNRVTEQFPEVADAFRFTSADVALDGEIVAVGPEGRPRPFLVLAERIHRKAPTRTLLASIPVAFLAYDLLADDRGEALDRPWFERRARLEHFLQTLGPTAVVRANPVRPMTGEDLDRAYLRARERGHEGLVLKRTDAFYEAGRRTASWIKVKQAFATLDCVITAAEEGNGKRAGVWSDYTFAVWNGDELVNIGKAYSGLTDEEIETLTSRLRKMTLDRFGRVRTVRPEIVLEIAFDGVQKSARHKSGFALRFPRILRLRDDKPPEQADTLDAVRAIYAAQLESGHREEPKPEPRPRVSRRKRAAEAAVVQLEFNFAEPEPPAGARLR
jgi:DNA ligase-1